MQIYHIEFDGSCEPNPNGFASFGVHIPELNIKISEAIGSGKGMTNNVAEWTGALKGLEYIADKAKERDEIILIGDSQLVIRQLSGQYSVSSNKLIPLYQKATKIVTKLKQAGVGIEFQHVPRDKNKVADELSHLPLLEYIKEKSYEMCDCGGIMIPKKSGTRRFLGCSHFPKCKNIKHLK